MSFIRKFKRNGRIYLAEVRNQRDGAKVRQEIIRYMGVQAETDRSLFPKNSSELKIDSARILGPVIVLDFIAKQLGLYELFGEHAHAILTLVFCHCHDYRSVSKAERWFEKTDLKQLFGIEEMTENTLRKAITACSKMDLLALQKSIFEKFINFSKEEIISVVYDVTNTYFTGKRCKLGKMGLDKEGVRGRKLVQIGLAITKKHGFPIFHQIHKGNIHDQCLFKEAVSHLKLFGIKRGVMVYDRGMTSKDTIFDLSTEHWKVIAGMPMHRGIKQMISKMDLATLENYRNRIEQGDTVFYVQAKKYCFGQNQGTLLIVLNPLKKQHKKQDRLRKIVEYQNKLQPGERGNSRYKKFFNKKGKLNAHALKREEKFDGLSFIFTNGKFTPREIVKAYFGKDTIEKSFQSLKGDLSLRPIRMWLEEHVEVHIFICYLSYCLFIAFRFFLDKNRGKPGFSELDGISHEEAFDELNDVYRIYFHKEVVKGSENHQLSKLVTPSKRQEIILKAVSEKLIFKNLEGDP